MRISFRLVCALAAALGCAGAWAQEAGRDYPSRPVRLVVPKGTPAPIIDKLHAAMQKTLSLSEVREELARQGAEVFTGSPEDFRRFLAQDLANTVKVIKAAQLQPD